MKLSRSTIDRISSSSVELPKAEYFSFSEKVLQFGTGVLLRGLPDYFIDKANKQGLFKGRIVVVKSTGSGDLDSFRQQDNLYTCCVRGLANGELQEELSVNASISRVIAAKDHWADVLDCAANAELQVIISNTTEIGIQLSSDDIGASPPISFPGKLLAFLYRRYQYLGGSTASGMVIIPTELLPDNGKKLLEIILQLGKQHNLEESFLGWLKDGNHWCNSLVDRIVPGKMPPADQQKLSRLLGYEDELMIMAETYRLWAIESAGTRVKEILSFAEADAGIVIAADIHIFRELKLRLLNGSHTLSCGLAHLAGFTTVKHAIADRGFYHYTSSLMLQEITPAIVGGDLTEKMATDFAAKVLDRYANPYLDHKWLSITLQYSSKMRSRDLPLLVSYQQRFSSLPPLMTLGWAAHILFMKCTQGPDGAYFGEYNGNRYAIEDDQAHFYAAQWAAPGLPVQAVLSNKAFWGIDLSAIPGFTEAVSNDLQYLQQRGARALLEELVAATIK